MPQVSLYMDSDTINLLTEHAKAAQLSMSKYVVAVLRDSFENAWPEYFTSLFGSISDTSFEAPLRPEFDADARREPI